MRMNNSSGNPRSLYFAFYSASGYQGTRFGAWAFSRRPTRPDCIWSEAEGGCDHGGYLTKGMGYLPKGKVVRREKKRGGLSFTTQVSAQLSGNPAPEYGIVRYISAEYSGFIRN